MAASRAASRNRLYLFTDEFPWGSSEKPFVIPEIEALRREYEIIVVSLARDCVLSQGELVSELPDDVGVVHWRRHPKALRMLWALGMPFSAPGLSEIGWLVRDGLSLRRLLDSFQAYANARSLCDFCRKSGLFEDAEDNIYMGFWFNTQCLALSLEKWGRPGMKLVCRLHGYDLYNERQPNGRQPWQRFMRDRCNKVVFIGDWAKSYFEDKFGPELREHQYVLNNLGVSRANRTPGREPNDCFKVVSCSNVIPLKRVGLIVAAIKLLSSYVIEWVHFGDGPELEQVRAAAMDAGINARFTGYANNADIRKYYEANHVTVFLTVTSTEGGAPVSVQEALACGIPVVGTDVGGVSEEIDGNGVLLPADPTVEEIAQAIYNVCFATREEWRAMSDRSIEIWSEKYNVEKNKKELLRILKEI